MDAARTARRLGAASVTVAYRRGRDEMPAHHVEADDAERRAWPSASWSPRPRSLGDAQRRRQRPALHEDAPRRAGRVRPPPPRARSPAASSTIDVRRHHRAPSAWRADTRAVRRPRRRPTANGRLARRPDHAARPRSRDVFAAGDAVTRPHGHHPRRRRGPPGRPHDRPLARPAARFDDFDDRLPVVDKAGRSSPARRRTRFAPPHARRHGAPAAPRATSTRSRRRSPRRRPARAAGRCIDCAVCSECDECVNACPVDGCIDLRAARRGSSRSRSARSSSRPASSSSRPTSSPSTGSARYKNVITGMQMDRLLAPTRPFNTILRPGDGKVPERIAYVLCTGLARRDRRQPALLAVLLHVLHQAEPAAHGRPAPGRRHRPLHGHPGRRASATTSSTSRRRRWAPPTSRAASPTSPRQPDGDLVLRYEDIENGGAIVEAEYDLVVLAVGVQPNRDAERLFDGRRARARRVALRRRAGGGPQPGPDRASRASSWPVPRRAPRTSPTRSSTRAPPWPRSRPTSSGRSRLPQIELVPA